MGRQMKIELDYEACDHILVAVLKDSMESQQKFGTEEPEYTERYIKAAQMVIDHFTLPPKG